MRLWRLPGARFRTLFLAFVLVVAGHTTLDHVGRDATVVPDELVAQSGAGKVGFRLRNDKALLPSVYGDEQFTVGERHLDRLTVPEIDPFVDADVFRQDLGRDLHRRFLGVRALADPALLPVAAEFIADRFHQLRVGSK